MYKFIKEIRYLCEGILAGIFYLILRIMPLDLASSFGSYMLRTIGPYLKAAHVARKNITMCFPDKTSQEINSIMEGMWDNLGRIIGEAPHILDLNFSEFDRRCKFHEPPKFKKSAIFVSGHLGNFELPARLLRQFRINANLVYRPVNNRFINYLIKYIREKNGNKLIPKGNSGLRKIMKILEDGGNVAMLIDQKMNDGIDTKFFGFQAKTTALPAKLAIKYNLPIYLVHLKRDKKCKFNIYFKELKINKIRDPLILTQHINDIIEAWIKEDPSQWFWVHKRWN